VLAPNDVEQAVLQDGDWIVKPVDTSLHQAYSFYVKVTASGGSYDYFGPFVLNVGCFLNSVSFTDSPSFLVN